MRSVSHPSSPRRHKCRCIRIAPPKVASGNTSAIYRRRFLPEFDISVRRLIFLDGDRSEICKDFDIETEAAAQRDRPEDILEQRSRSRGLTTESIDSIRPYFGKVTKSQPLHFRIYSQGIGVLFERDQVNRVGSSSNMLE